MQELEYDKFCKVTFDNGEVLEGYGDLSSSGKTFNICYDYTDYYKFYLNKDGTWRCIGTDQKKCIIDYTINTEKYFADSLRLFQGYKTKFIDDVVNYVHKKLLIKKYGIKELSWCQCKSFGSIVMNCPEDMLLDGIRFEDSSLYKKHYLDIHPILEGLWLMELYFIAVFGNKEKKFVINKDGLVPTYLGYEE